MDKKFKKLLETFEKEISDIDKQLGEFTVESNEPGNYNACFPSHERDQESNAMAVQEMERRKALEHELEERRNIVKGIIKKIEKGTYGICENCSIKIDERRLKVVPVAHLCVDCGAKSRG